VRYLFFSLLVLSGACAHNGGSNFNRHVCQDLTKADSTATGRLDGSVVVARWSGGELLYAEIEKEGRGRTRQLRNDFFTELHEHELDLLNSRIAKSLIRIEAEKKGQNEEDYMSSVAEQAENISEEQVREFFDANQSRLNQPFELLRDQIQAYLKQEKQKELVRAEINRLYEVAQVEILLPEPSLIPVNFNLEGRPRKGPADAAVTIVEFSDFECPYCRVAASDLERRLKTREDKVAVVFLHFPLRFHKNAKPAAIATECAHRQGKFWEFHNAVFESQKELTEARYLEIALELKLDTDGFKACLSDPTAAKQVESDMEQGKKAGVKGTPSFFINGLFSTSGIPSEEDLDKLIQP